VSAAQFTPAPWYLDGGFVYAERNRETVRAAKAKDRNSGDGNIPLAKIIADFAGEQQANANLIAAAPELFEALVELKRSFWDEARVRWTADDFLRFAAVEQATTALAKARGEQAK
jgi:hypothetical protein